MNAKVNAKANANVNANAVDAVSLAAFVVCSGGCRWLRVVGRAATSAWQPLAVRVVV